MLPDGELEVIAARNAIRREIHNAATPGPWHAGDTSEGLAVFGPDPTKAADVIFIAHGRNDTIVVDVDMLLAEVRRLRECACALEAVADAADNLLLHSFGTEEAFNPSTYEVEGEYVLALRNTLATLQNHE